MPEPNVPGALLARLEQALAAPDLELANDLCLELRCALQHLSPGECQMLLTRVQALRERATALKATLALDLKHRGVRRSAASAYRAVPQATA